MEATAKIQSSEVLEFVSFVVANQSFCLEITEIREIRRWAPVTALPRAPADILGVMNLRGTVIPIVDLGSSLGLGKTEPSSRSVVIVVTIAEKVFGLVVQSVSEILSTPSEEIEDMPQSQATEARRMVKGLINTADGMTQLLDLKTVLETSMTMDM